MKRRITLLVVLAMLLTLPALATNPQHPGRGGPDFCYEGWVLTEHSSLSVGNGCYYIEDTYECFSTNETLVCHHLQCPGGGSTGEVCEKQ